MATVEAKQETQEVRDVLARVSKFFQKHEARANGLTEAINDLRALSKDVVQLLNAQESLDRRKRDAELDLARVEKEAKTRLQSIEQSHSAILDRVSKKEIEIDGKLSDLAKREDKAAAVRRDAEVLKDHYEKKLAGITEVSKRGK